MLKLSKKNESGRSMIEMLGVLAVIGVLSVGGITGYTTAMNSHYANQAADQARRLAAVASAKRLINPSAYLTGSETEGKYTFTMDSTDKDFIKLTVTGLPAAVASRVKGMNWEIADVADGETDGSLVFTFKNDLSEISPSDGGQDQNQGGQQEPTIVVNCTTGTSTSNSGENTNEKTANGPCKCPSDSPIWSGTECVGVYVIGDVYGTHYELTADAANVCPSNYHWATVDEILSDFNCSNWIDDGYRGHYACADIDFEGFLRDCGDSSDYKTIVGCGASAYTFNTSSGGLGCGADRAGHWFAACKHN